MIIGVADTMFSRVDMFRFVKAAYDDLGISPKLIRRTVPGVKDLPVACKNLLKECDICIALGMPGPEPIDKQCAHEASQGLIQAQLMTGKHIVEVFVHMDEAKNDNDLYELCKNRAYKHGINAYWLIAKPEELEKRAGTGERQGRENAGRIGE